MDAKDPIVRRFFRHARNICDGYGVDIVSANRRYLIVNGKKANGYFEPPHHRDARGKIVYARKMRYPRTLYVRLHEFGHFEQWAEQTYLWKQEEYLSRRVEEVRERGVPVPTRDLIALSFAERALEIDCERRVLRLIGEWGLPIDPRDYKRHANKHILHLTEKIEKLIDDLRAEQGNDLLAEYFVKKMFPRDFLHNSHDTPDFIKE